MNDLDHALRALADELAFKAPDRARIDIERLRQAGVPCPASCST